jgi:NAD(P)-dependent dehydrogenase (short-subunit alcohol dehydrogenase family)
MKPLEGKVAFLTGAGRGLGVGIAVALAKAGASVGLFGRKREALEETAAKMAEVGGKAHIAIGDVRERDQVNAGVASTTEALGPIWALVNNAYAADDRKVEDIDDENLDYAIRSCIHGSLYPMQACFPTMREHGGRIINFGSGSATMGLPNLGSYNIAKEGVRGLTKSAAAGWGQYGITVNNVCPLATSPAYEKWFASISEEDQQAHLESILLRRMGDPEQDIGALVVFLAGPGGGYITGRTIHVDGGRCYYDR